jgi:hypothetical protein
VKKLLLATAALLAISTAAAFACAPAPTCWMKPPSDKEYLRSVCRNYENASVQDVPNETDDPEAVAC